MIGEEGQRRKGEEEGNRDFPLFASAPLPLFALKFKNFSWADNKVRYIFLALAAVLLIIFKVVGVPLIIVLYIVLSIISNLFSKKIIS